MRVELLKGPVRLDATIEAEDGLVYIVLAGGGVTLQARLKPSDAELFVYAINRVLDEMSPDDETVRDLPIPVDQTTVRPTPD